MTTPKISWAVILLCMFSILVGCLYWIIQTSIPRHLVINEMSFANNDGNDWIEIYNPTMNSLSLEGMYITDSQSEMKKFRISKELVVPQKGFIVVSGSDASNTNVQMNFNIKAGETIYLIAANGSDIVDSFAAISMDTRMGTLGRFPNGASDIFFMTQATKGSANVKDFLFSTPQP